MLLDTGRNKLDLMTTALGGKEAVEVAISPPLTGDTRTMRIAPPCPGTLTSFTGTILAPGLMECCVVPPVAADNVVTVIDEDMPVVDDSMEPDADDIKAGVPIVTTLLLTEPVVRKIVLGIGFMVVLAVVKTTCLRLT